MLESTIVQAIRREVRRRGGWSAKVHGDRFTGSDIDLHICLRGRFIALEVKVPGKEPTAKQEYVLNEIRDAGGIAACVHSLEEANRVFDSVD